MSTEAMQSSDNGADDLYRPKHHFSPMANWMNDPNGLVYHAGEYHLFYQYNPTDIVWGAMHWGHAVSRDLVNWQHLPIALYPDEDGVIFSGSALVDRNNTAGFGKDAMVAIFTHHKTGSESQSIAYSLDFGRTWEKYKGNPILKPPGHFRNFRDPKVFWYGDSESGHWVMCLAAGNAIIFYTSFNLRNWQPGGRFGARYSAEGDVWETPDMFQLPVGSGQETRWVLTVGVIDGGPAGGSGTKYFIGRFNGQTFTSENPPGTTLWADHGPDYYAAQSWNNEPNGRRVMIGWISNWRYAQVVPTFPWRGMFSLPRELAIAQTGNGHRLVQYPIAELNTLRCESHHWQNEIFTPGLTTLAFIQGACLEIEAEFELSYDTSRFGFHVRSSQCHWTSISYDLKEKKLFLDRSLSGLSDFHTDFAQACKAPMQPIGGLIRLHIFVDRSSVEIFGNGGLVVLSASIFPSAKSQELAIFAEGHAIRVRTLNIHKLKPAQYSYDSLQRQNANL